MTYEDACVALELMKAEQPQEYESLLRELTTVVETLNRELEATT
jgi:hypothetical protein